MLLMTTTTPGAGSTTPATSSVKPSPPPRHRPPPSPRPEQGLAKSFRFPSLSSLSRRKMAPPVLPPRPPHLDVSQWLAVLELSEYAPSFAAFSGVEELLWFSEADVKELGVRNSAHRARIMSSLVALRTKYERGNRRRGGDKLQRHSVAVDSGRLVDRSINTDLLLRGANDTPQSKSLDNLNMDGPDEVAAAAALRKALEWELSLDTRDLRSHAWYHGAIPRPRAEEITAQDGQFLVRDCTSQPGDYVLSCRYRGQPLHFVINKVVLQPDTVYERIQYQFEDDAFDTVPDLITFYVGSGKSISVLSGAKITTPRNRLYPLSFYASKYTLQHQQYQQFTNHSGLTSPGSLTSPSSAHAPARLNLYSNNMVAAAPASPSPGGVHSPPPPLRANKPPPPPRLPNKQHRSQSLTPATLTEGVSQVYIEERGNSADGMVQPVSNDPSKFSTHSLPRQHHTQRSPNPSITSTMPRSKIVRVTSDPTLSPCLERRRFGYIDEPDPTGGPPPKPSRVPSLMGGDSAASTAVPRGVYHASGSDSGNGSGDSVQSSADNTDPMSVSTLQRSSVGVVIKNPIRSYSPPDAVEPELEPASAFDLDNFSTLLLPTLENKPLDATALQGVKLMLSETGPRLLANHLTKVDIELAHAVGSLTSPPDLGLGVNSGIELCSLPHGHQLRLDLIERTRCMQLFVAVTVLSGTSETERAETLHRWIQVAVDTKTALGNLFGFCAVMMGLCMPQLQRLSSTWHVLRQRFTDSAFSFEAKLRPVLKSMNECTNPQAPNTTIPHMLPYVLLHERQEALTCEDDTVYPSPTCWESSSPDMGLGTLFEHLQTARKFADSESMYRRNAEIVLGEAKLDDLLIDAFRTEFHLKFLWGSRGATVSSQDRHAKFLQVLSAMSEKCEPSFINSPCQPTASALQSPIGGPTHTAV